MRDSTRRQVVSKLASSAVVALGTAAEGGGAIVFVSNSQEY